MLRHIFVGPTLPGCTDASLADVVDTLRELPTLVPWIRCFSVKKTLDWSGTQAVVLIRRIRFAGRLGALHARTQAPGPRRQHQRRHRSIPHDRCSDERLSASRGDSKYYLMGLKMSAHALRGKVALVTGGGTGLGFGGAKRLAEAGAYVYIVGRGQGVIDEAAQKLGPNVRAIAADVTRKEDMVRVASIIRAEKGNLDIIFSNAGYYQGGKLEEVSEEFFDAMLNVNLKGQLFAVRAMLPIMNNGGSIILTSSMTAFIGLSEYTAYAATKAAVVGMARVWTTELKARKIRVNVISPGAIPTEGYETVQGMTPEQVQAFADKCASEIPLGRMGRADEIGDGVVFLASDASSFINGINLVADGGQTQVYAGNL